MASPNTPKPHSSQAWLQHSSPEIRIFYTECLPSSKPKGTILLIYGFPETSHQYRHVLVPLASAGYRVLASDYRGHTYSSKPADGYTKAILSQHLDKLVTEHLHIKEKIHIVGHDIGGMIAATDLAVALTTGKERMYLKHFFDRSATNRAAITEQDLDFYSTQDAQAGALRAAFSTYRMFGEGAAQNRKWVEEGGKVGVRCMALGGENVFMTARAYEIVSEMYEDVEMGVLEGCGHHLAEENPEGFVKLVLGFVEKE